MLRVVGGDGEADFCTDGETTVGGVEDYVGRLELLCVCVCVCVCVLVLRKLSLAGGSPFA